MYQPTLNDEELALLDELLGERFGLSFPEHKRSLLESRLRPRLEELKLHSFFDYYLRLRADGGCELGRLVSLLTNNESYFFRETYQFDALVEDGFAALGHGPWTADKPLRMLCAGCAAGEEPFSLAIHLSRAGRLSAGAMCIDAFDIDPERIERARKGVYGPHALRAAEPEAVERYFKARGPEAFELRETWRRGVKLAVGNIVEPSTYRRSIGYDVIFCRNVLIYFSEVALHRAINAFACTLRPGGLLFLGHSESIIGLSPKFETVRLGKTLAYRRVSS